MSRFELPVSTPESVGIPSAAIQRFLNRLEEKRLPMHSVLMQRGGKMVFENYWKPFDKDRKHRMYSTSKSFTSAAIGILAGEGKISLDDPMIKFFPDKVPENVHPWIAETTIRHMLKMTMPTNGTSYKWYDPDWADSVFNDKPTHRPGQIFSYNTSAPDMMCNIIKRVTGQDLTEYLRDRFFEPAGMNTDIWCIQSPCGHDWGGSGVMCTPRDLMKFALVFLNEGKLNGKQIVPADYARDAVSKLVDNSFRATNPEKAFGYGYQFWRHRHGWFTSGMGSQLAIAFPEQDFICVTTADTQGYPSAALKIIESLSLEILPYLEAGSSLPEDPAAHQALLDAVSDREILCCKGEKESPLAAMVSGKTYKMYDNTMNISWMRFTFEGDEGVWEYENDTGVHAIRFGFGHQVSGEFPDCMVSKGNPERHYFGKTIGTPPDHGYDICTSAGWVGDKGLLVWCHVIDDYFGSLRLNFAFEENRVTLLSVKCAEWFFNEYSDGFASGIAE
ncbi:MAG: serine hydrolase [Ruminococcaceae bacterium]|nr:serine hydrolase [Oscillospiraceae bacterium]